MNSGLSFGLIIEPYDKFRPAYPKRLFDQIIKGVPLHMRNLAMDLGAGTGLSTLPLCKWFKKVIAVEPDPKMTTKLRKLHAKIIVCQTTAEERKQELATADLVTSGNALYWMNGPMVISNIVTWLKPNGLLAVYRYGFPKATNEVQVLLEKELKLKWDAFRHPRLYDEQYSQRCIMESKVWKELYILNVPNIVSLTPHQLVGFLRSTSYVSSYLKTLEDAEGYLRYLESSIKKIVSNNSILVDFKLELLLARK